jgi:hypothetical protein
MAKSINGLEIGIIITLGITLDVGNIMWIVWEKGVSDCEKGESPLCLTGTCPSATSVGPSGNGSGCGLSPFKVDSSGKAVTDSNGNLICKGAIIDYAGGPPKVNAFST